MRGSFNLVRNNISRLLFSVILEMTSGSMALPYNFCKFLPEGGSCLSRIKKTMKREITEEEKRQCLAYQDLPENKAKKLRFCVEGAYAVVNTYEDGSSATFLEAKLSNNMTQVIQGICPGEIFFDGKNIRIGCNYEYTFDVKKSEFFGRIVLGGMREACLVLYLMDGVSEFRPGRAAATFEGERIKSRLLQLAMASLEEMTHTEEGAETITAWLGCESKGATSRAQPKMSRQRVVGPHNFPPPRRGGGGNLSFTAPHTEVAGGASQFPILNALLRGGGNLSFTAPHTEVAGGAPQFPPITRGEGSNPPPPSGVAAASAVKRERLWDRPMAESNEKIKRMLMLAQNAEPSAFQENVNARLRQEIQKTLGLVLNGLPVLQEKGAHKSRGNPAWGEFMSRSDEEITEAGRRVFGAEN